MKHFCISWLRVDAVFPYGVFLRLGYGFSLTSGQCLPDEDSL